MGKLKEFLGHGKLLLNENGRLSDCLCCCPNLPSTLYFHLEPNYNLPDCTLDTGFSDIFIGSHPQLGDSSPSNSCNLWQESVINEGILTCTAGGDEVPPVTFGVLSRLLCLPVNHFQAELCWGTPAAPSDYGQCFRTTLHDSVLENTCEADPGEFLVDIGNIVPLEGTLSECDCTFHGWFDENPTSMMLEANPIYYYPAESAAGVQPLTSAIWYWELIPTIRTPLYWGKKTIYHQKSVIPDDIKTFLNSL